MEKAYKKLSIVIPTLWLVDFFKSTLEKLHGCELVDEIVIISNSKNRLDLSHLSKVKILQMSSNIGVNPAWNIGVAHASNDDVLVINDDYIFDLEFLNKVIELKDDYAMLAVNPDKQATEVVSITKRPDGFGCAFYINKKDYATIPEDLKIYFGDDWLFQNCLLNEGKVGLVPNIKDNGVLSISSKSFAHIVLIEFHNYMKHLDSIQNYEFKFSIVIPYYHESASIKEVNSLLDSFESQSFKNFEVILIHDGPNPETNSLLLERSFKLSYEETSIRYNDWGHSLRDMGISQSKGEYLIILNCDNKLYDFALEELNRLSEDPIKLKRIPWWDSKDILIYPIYLRGQTSDGFNLMRDESLAGEVDMILPGYPVQKNCIDCMQLVMKRIRWDYYGGWKDKSFAADGEMYPRFVRENLGAIYSSKILGEHL
jgi:hypothetical protein